jgi:hypothetical protein
MAGWLGCSRVPQSVGMQGLLIGVGAGSGVACGQDSRKCVGKRLTVSGLITVLVPDRLVGMYLRTTQQKNRDNSVVRYVPLAHNRRVGRVRQAQVLLNLGREDQLDREGLLRLVASINRYLGIAEAEPPGAAAELVGTG